MTISLLPEELLAEILSYFELCPDHHLEGFNPPLAEAHQEEERRKLRTLRRLCLVNKRVSRIASPVLYNTVDFELLNSSAYQPPAFLRTLLARPNAQSLVHTLRFPRWDTGIPERTSVPWLRDLTVQGVRTIPMSSGLREFFLQECDMANDCELQQIVLGLILYVCVDLEVWRLDDLFSAVSGDSTVSADSVLPVAKVINDARGEPADEGHRLPLQRLRHVLTGRSIARDMDDNKDLALWSPLLSLPRLERWTDFNGICARNTVFQSVNPASFNIELVNAHVTGDGLAQLLQAFPRLENLSVFIEEYFEQHEPRELQYEHLGQALEELGTEMRTLVLRPSRDNPDWSANARPRTCLGSLEKLTRLRSLSIGLEMVVAETESDVGWLVQPLSDLLPASLEILVFNDCLYYGYFPPSRCFRLFDDALLQVLGSRRLCRLHTIYLDRSGPFRQTDDMHDLHWRIEYRTDPDTIVLSRTGKLMS